VFPILSYIFQPVSGHYVAARKKININIAYETFTMLSTWGPTFSADLAALFRQELATRKKGTAYRKSRYDPSEFWGHNKCLDSLLFSIHGHRHLLRSIKGFRTEKTVLFVQN
jgi:hypothetical protein